MRMFITVLVLAMVGLPASAKSKAAPAKKAKAKAAAAKISKFSGKLLSYEALVRLPKAKRKKYLRDTVDLIATMESFNNKYTVAELDQMREMREQVAQLMKMVSLLPEAKADDFDDEPPVVDIAKIFPAHVGNDWSCGPAAKFDPVFRTCVVLNAAGQTTFAPASSSEEGAIKCPSGSQQVPHYRGESVACIPAASYARVPAARKAAFEAKTFESVRSFRSQTFEQQRLAVLGGPSGSAAPVAPTAPAATAPVTPSSPANFLDGGEVQPVPPPAESALVNEPGETAYPIGPDGQPSTPTPGAATPAAENAPANPAPAPETAEPAPPAAAPATPAAPAAPETCEPAIQACKKLSPGDRESAITRFRTSEPYQGVDANICVAGGFASKYRGTKKDPGSCEIKRSLDLGGGKTTPPCAAGEALCNPVLFCIGAKNASGKFEPVTFCVKKSGDSKNRPITDACASKFAKMIEHKADLLECPKVDAKATAAQKREAKKKCDAMKKVKGEACDPAYMPTEVNAKKLWEELTAATVKLRDVWCGKLDFAALFCRECEVVNDKVYAMNKSATGSGCPEVGAAPERAAPARTQPAPSTTAPAEGGSNGVREGTPTTTPSSTDEERPDGR